MAGGTNLKEVLNSIQITLDKTEYCFASVKTKGEVDSSQVLCTFLESDKLSRSIH